MNSTDQLIDQLKTAATVPHMARLVAALLRECGVFNPYSVGLEVARQAITNDPNEGRPHAL